MLCINILNQDSLGIRFLLSFFRSFLLRSHDMSNSPFPRYFKRKVDRETLAPERGYGKYTSNMAAKETVPRRAIYCCVPLRHSYSGKVVNGKAVKLHRLPKETKARRIWISRLRNVRQSFSAKSGTRAYSLHFKGEEGPKPWCQFHLCSPRSQSRNPYFEGIDPCLTD